MTNDIKILPELRDLIPPLSNEELEQLHREIEADGRANVPLTVWKEKNVLVDGHHRYVHCMKHGFPFEVSRRSFTDFNEVKNHMIMHQLGRRNLDPMAASLLRGQLYNARKNKQGGDRKSKDHGDTLKDTAATVAKETGVSKATVKRDGALAKAVDNLDKAVKKGEITQEGKDLIIKNVPRKLLLRKSKSPTIWASWYAEKETKKKEHDATRYIRVIKSFERLDYDQQKLVMEGIERIWQKRGK